MKCPKCGSSHLSDRHPGRDAFGHFGALLGASFGAARAMQGARVGATLCMPAGPVAAAAGGMVGAVLSGVLMGSMASAVGALFGHVADQELFDNRRCESCGHTFRASDSDAHEHTDTQTAGCAHPHTDEEITGAGAGEHWSVPREQHVGGTH